MTMKDSLNELFHQRFQGHEAPVDPAVWQVIEARLLTTPPAADPVNELLRERFSGHEVNVAPAVWQNIGTQLGHGAGFGSFGWIAAGIGGVVLTGGLLYMLSGQPNKVAIAQPQHVEVATQQAPIIPNGEEPGGAVLPAIVQQRHDEAPVAASMRNATRTGSDAELVVVTGPEEDIPVPAAEGFMDTSGAPVVRGIIAAIEDAAERELLLSQQAANTPGTDASKLPASPENPPSESIDPGVDEVAAEQKEPCTLYIENIFTPNNDGINDAYVVQPPPCITSARIRIFSISGQLVFTMNNYEPWVGANCEEGWYLVAGEASTIEGNMIPVKGTVFLKRSNN